jgi:hypothetical protein
MVASKRCPNFNHGRANAPVRFCPNCGEIVNEQIRAKKCGEAKHAESRRNMNRFCIDCGTRLIKQS